MTPLRIAAIVEGHGETKAIEVLCKRIAQEARTERPLAIDPVLRQPASKLLKQGELERHVEYAARRLGRPGGILVLLDSDGRCPAELGPKLQERVRLARQDFPSSVILAHHEFEAWFLGTAESLAGIRGLPTGLCSHPAPEAVRGCKEWISEQLPHGRPYDPPTDQQEFCRVMDLEVARRNCPSFEKFHREIVELLLRIPTSP